MEVSMSKFKPLYLFAILLASLLLQASSLPQQTGIPAPVLTAPSREITNRRPTYEWQPVSGTTSYFLTVYMSDRSMVFLKVPVNEARCTSELCRYRPNATLLNGNYKFKVKAKVGGIFGPASAWMTFNVNAAQSPDLIYIDHTTADITKIPDAWITQAKNLDKIHFAHTSHGSQLLTGLDYLQSQKPIKYRYAITYDPTTFPSETGALKIYDGNSYEGNNYITPEMYWATADGITHTKMTLNTNNFNSSGWTWCGQMSSNDIATVNLYINKLKNLDNQYADVDMIYFTGHTDPGARATLNRNNNKVRDYVIAYGGILFDFNDIESFDPTGRYYPATTDACTWCNTWCNTHPTDCQDLPTDCAHSHGFNCKVKGEAFWWMTARMAGWNGVP
jgi:hypothetical protein